jgi:hypothetical protein
LNVNKSKKTFNGKITFNWYGITIL